MSDELEIEIGEKETHRVRIRPLWRERPGDSDYWDGNWIICNVSLQAAPFSGSFQASLRADELASFETELAALQDNLSGTAKLHAMDGQFSLNIVGDGRGHFTAMGTAREDPGSGVTLHVTLSFDQTYLPTLRRRFRRMNEAFPVVGEPDV